MKIDFVVRYSMYMNCWYVRNSDAYYIHPEGDIDNMPLLYDSVKEANEALRKWKIKSGYFYNEFIKEQEMKI